jgi:hypothetical protein
VAEGKSRLLGQELLGAELLASRELAEGAGSFWDALERGGAIHQHQIQLFVNDYAQFADELIRSRNPAAVPTAVLEHFGRRLEHLSAGWAETGELLREEFNPIQRAWDGFFHVIRQDWRR